MATESIRHKVHADRAAGPHVEQAGGFLEFLFATRTYSATSVLTVDLAERPLAPSARCMHRCGRRTSLLSIPVSPLCRPCILRHLSGGRDGTAVSAGLEVA